MSVLCSACAPNGVEPDVLTDCNGSELLCDKQFNQVVFATTHNAFNYAVGPVSYQGPNQDYPITRQLEDGVRAFMLDIYPHFGTDSTGLEIPWVYHSFPLFGNELLTSILNEIQVFMKANPSEVITICFQCDVEFDKVKLAFELSGLDSYVYAHDEAMGWPSLREMISEGKRLFVMSDCEDPNAEDWYHYVWDHAVETHFDIDSRDQFSCEFNRGDPGN